MKLLKKELKKTILSFIDLMKSKMPYYSERIDINKEYSFRIYIEHIGFKSSPEVIRFLMVFENRRVYKEVEVIEAALCSKEEYEKEVKRSAFTTFDINRESYELVKEIKEKLGSKSDAQLFLNKLNMLLVRKL